MSSRREFFVKGSRYLLFLSNFSFYNWRVEKPVSGGRPPENQRKFNSFFLEEWIEKVKAIIQDPVLRNVFEYSFSYSLDYKVSYSIQQGKPYTFFEGGATSSSDSLRNSSIGLWAYLRHCKEDKVLKSLFQGIVNYHTNVLLFQKIDEDLELDALCYPIRVAHQFWKITEDCSALDQNWLKSIKKIIQIFEECQSKNPTNGLILTQINSSSTNFKPVFSIPMNLFIHKSLEDLMEILSFLQLEKDLWKTCNRIKVDIWNSIHLFGTYHHPQFGEIYAFEVDIEGHKVFMDMTQISSLLSLPYLGVVSMNSEIYRNTRNYIWSPWNPYFCEMGFISGRGQTAENLPTISLISLIMSALTSFHEKEIIACLTLLNHSQTSIHQINSQDSHLFYPLLGELFTKIYFERPHILQSFTL